MSQFCWQHGPWLLRIFRGVTLGIILGTLTSALGFFVDLLDLRDRISNRTSTSAFYSSPEYIDYFFPLHLGAEWTYSFSTLNWGIEELERKFGQYTEKVIDIYSYSSDDVIVVEVQILGDSPYPKCQADEVDIGDISFWYVTDHKNLFVSCEYDEALKIASSLLTESSEDLYIEYLPIYRTPFNVGSYWDAFHDIRIEGTAYRWFVESIVDVDVPAGQFTDCARVVLCTLPDETIRWICPGVGLVAQEKRHHGPPWDYMIELSSFSFFQGEQD